MFVYTSFGAVCRTLIIFSWVCIWQIFNSNMKIHKSLHCLNNMEVNFPVRYVVYILHMFSSIKLCIACRRYMSIFMICRECSVLDLLPVFWNSCKEIADLLQYISAFLIEIVYLPSEMHSRRRHLLFFQSSPILYRIWVFHLHMFWSFRQISLNNRTCTVFFIFCSPLLKLCRQYSLQQTSFHFILWLHPAKNALMVKHIAACASIFQ